MDKTNKDLAKLIDEAMNAAFEAGVASESDECSIERSNQIMAEALQTKANLADALGVKGCARRCCFRVQGLLI